MALAKPAPSKSSTLLRTLSTIYHTRHLAQEMWIAHRGDAHLGQARGVGAGGRVVLLQHVTPAGHAVLQLRSDHRDAQRRRQRPCQALHHRHLQDKSCQVNAGPMDL